MLHPRWSKHLSQIAHRQPAQLPDGSPGIMLQIPYLEEFFHTKWYLIHNDTYELYAIYDAIFTEIPYFAQLQPFDLVALDTNLQEHRDSRINHVRMCMGWIAQVVDSFMKWWESAPSCRFLHEMVGVSPNLSTLSLHHAHL